MRDISRSHPAPSLRSVPYRKREPSGILSSTRGTRRSQDVSPVHSCEIVFPHPPDRTHNSLCDGAQPSHTISSVDVEHRSPSKTGGDHEVSHTLGHVHMGRSTRERPSHKSALSTRADASGPFIRLPPTSALTATVLTGQKRAGSPLLGSVTTFLRTINLPDKLSSAPPDQASFPLSPPSCVPVLSTDNTNKTGCANRNDHHITLVHKGYPFTYDLSALPEDPKGTIALLAITKSDPGAYLLVSAHYRRTGRSRAACAVIRSLLEYLGTPSGVDKRMGDAAPIPALRTSTVTLASPCSPCSNPIDWTASVFKSAATRPAMLLLAACELDISREHPDDPESESHVSIAHDLFRAVYGTVNNAIVAGAIRSQPKSALNLELSSNGDYPSPNSNSQPPSNELSREVEPLKCVKDLERELSTTRVVQKKLQEKLIMSDNRLTCAEGRVHMLESHSREMLVQLDAWQDENWELRRRLAESERMVKELARYIPNAESRFWGRLKDLSLDNLETGARGE